MLRKYKKKKESYLSVHRELVHIQIPTQIDWSIFKIWQPTLNDLHVPTIQDCLLGMGGQVQKHT